ncbi:MAG: TetR/AcrR family transcriptional regulator [Actinobacteria bacterium]|nr:TetR/AcrR family transcriptional regulator [Actinomycetota bacterium]
MARPTNFNKRLALLDTVVSYLGEHRVRVTSLRGIAKDLNINPNILVHHFGTRSDLMRAALHRALALQLIESRPDVGPPTQPHPGRTRQEVVEVGDVKQRPDCSCTYWH